MKKLPYRAETATGDTYEVDFPLHEHTVDAVRVSQLISEILERIDRSIAVSGETGNGDVLQAMAMAMAIRAEMIYAPHGTTSALSVDLLQSALAAMADSTCSSKPVGHA